MDVDGRATQEQLPSEVQEVLSNKHAACALAHIKPKLFNKKQLED
jgi:hypothetical protein